MKTTVAKQIASLLEARKNCEQSNNQEWFGKHAQAIQDIAANFMPSGAGWDMGTKIDLDASQADKLVFYGSYHHMDDAGYYDGWTEHTIVVTPSLLSNINLRISGRNRNDIKEYLHETFYYALMEEVDFHARSVSEQKQ
jgi:hypothetical protein